MLLFSLFLSISEAHAQSTAGDGCGERNILRKNSTIYRLLVEEMVNSVNVRRFVR
jgi:hypothetical protein